MTSPVHRTTYTVEVFSRGPFVPASDDDDPFDLMAIHYAITEGDCVGNVERTHEMIVPPSALTSELLRIGNDGSFFTQDEEQS